MTPLIVALFDDFRSAERVRTELVTGGLPTDRVELTSPREAGQADSEPGEVFGTRVANYFHALLDQGGDAGGRAEEFAAQVLEGHATVAVHLRSEEEIATARDILGRHRPLALEELLH